MAAALDRPDGDRIGHQKRLETSLDGEQSGETLKHHDGKANAVPSPQFRQKTVNASRGLSIFPTLQRTQVERIEQCRAGSLDGIDQ